MHLQFICIHLSFRNAFLIHRSIFVGYNLKTMDHKSEDMDTLNIYP